MGEYQIIGHRRVAGKSPGETLSVDDLPPGAVAHLIAAGHLAAVKTTRKTTNAETQEED